MSLPSQSSRSGNTRNARFTLGSKRQASPAKRLAIIAIGLLVLGGGYWLFFTGEDDSRDNREGISVVGSDVPHDVAAPTAPITRASDPRDDINSTNGDTRSLTDINNDGTKQPRTTPANNDNDTPSIAMGARPDLEREQSRPQRPKPTPITPSATTQDRSTDTGTAPVRGSALRSGTVVEALVSEADGAMADGRIIAAREILNRALHNQSTTETEHAYLRARLADIADVLTFSDRVIPGDTMCREYRVQSGDFLSTIARREGTDTDWKFIQRINNMANPNALRLNQRLKLVQGPFHAVISKRHYRLDLFADERDSNGNRIFLRSMPVGLGEYDSTPAGAWVVRNREENPGWVNPRNSRERYDRDDPLNPIGEFWIGLLGTDENTIDESGIGLHGTIEPETIGTQASMGCVRLGTDDIAILYEVLMPERSEVVILDDR